jgi:hypothetical protein
MRTIDFSTLLYRWLQLAGLDRTAITSLNFQTFRDLANGRLEIIWKSDDWPDLLRSTVPPGDNVQTSPTGVRTVTLGPDVAEVLSVYDQDPRLTTRARLIKYYLYQDSTGRYINVMEAADPLFIEYRIPKPELFGDPYSATQAYSVGSQIYFDTSTNSGSYQPGAGKAPAGNLYNCIVATSPGQSPATTPSAWELVQIPYFTGEYLVRGCLADYLRSEGQFEQAVMADGDAEAIRQKEVERVLLTEGQVRRMNVFTY